MTYRKPEVLPLGQAGALIQGGKIGPLGENGDVTKNRVIPNSELDD